MLSSLHRPALVARTVRHLRPSQVGHRLRLRAQRTIMGRFPGPLAAVLRRPVSGRPGWPGGFSPLDGQLAAGCPSAEANTEGRFCFLGEERRLGHPPDWERADAPQLWRYHLHYMEWAWPFADHGDREWASRQFRGLWRSWRAGTTFGRWDAWSPYVASLRAWVLCALFGPLVAGTEDEADYVADLALHAGFLRANLELDVGGNHLLKNAKALIGSGVLLGDEASLRTGLRHLRRQLAVQVLADGGHFERSPSYHCQVLGDLVDVAELLAAAGHTSPEDLDDSIASMRRWLGAMLMPDGDVPLFNDCAPVGTDRLKLLEPAPPPPDRLVVLQPSGFVVARPDERVHLVADVGPPCPPELPAHAHADCLSFELALDGRRVVVDSGTSTYEPGPRRDHERSTAAHNTVEIDGENQTEVWGTFRAGRRAHATLERAVETAEGIEVIASHDGYRHLQGRPIHRRTWRLTTEGLELRDEVLGRGVHRLTPRLHLAPGLAGSQRSPFEVGVGALSIHCDHGSRLTPPPASLVSSGFGMLTPAPCAVTDLRGELPLVVRTTLGWTRATGSASADTAAGLPAREACS